MFFFWSKFFFFILKEKEIGEGGIDEVRMLPSEGNEVQTLSSRVTSTPECFRLFQLPWHLVVWLDRQHVEGHPGNKVTQGE